MFFPAQAQAVHPAHVQHVAVDRVLAIGDLVAAHRFLGHLGQVDAFDRGGSAGEVLFDELARQADRVKDLRTAIGLVGADAHLGHDLEDALADGLDVVLLNRLGIQRQFLADADFFQRFEGDIGVDRFGAVTGQHAEVMHFARFAGFNHQTGLHAQALTDEVVMHGGSGQQGGHRDAVRTLRAVGQDQDVLVLQHGFGRRPAHFLDRHFKAGGPGLGIPGDVDGFGAEGTVQRGFDRANLGHVLVGEDRLVDFKPLVRASFHAQQVRTRADHADQAHHQFFADRVDRRVGDLGKVLLEVIVEQAALVRQHGNRRVGAHRTDRIVAIGAHRLQELGNVFLGVAKGLLAIEQGGGFDCQLRQFRLDHFEVLELVLRGVEPVFVGLFG